jgi:ATP-dependent helicase/nuclease subunit A
VLREFKFSILDDGTSYSEGLEDEKILLQGVVDCAILDDDGITVIDFKTDRITEAELDLTVRNYTYQVEAYADALSRIFEKPIKRSCLYFFRLNCCVDV